MLKGLLLKVLRKLVKGLEKDVKKDIATYCKDRVSDESKRISYAKENAPKHVQNFDKACDTMVERILEQEEINECVQDVQAQLLVKGYKELRAILEEQHVQVCQHYVMMQKLSLGSYDTEKDNLEQYTKAQLVDMALELNQEQFRQRMIAQGKANVSKAQMDAITNMVGAIRKKKPEFSVATPKDKFEASSIIENLKKEVETCYPNRESAKMVGNITEKQLNTIVYLCKRLNKPFDAVQCKDIAEATQVISALSKELAEHPELQEKATDQQIDYVKRLLKALNKRWTAKREQEYRAMTKSEISNSIQELQKLVPENNEITEGQLTYIIQLCTKLNKPYNFEELKVITKQQATEIIDGLRREHLAILCKATGTPMSKEDIAKLSVDAVKGMIDNMLMEIKSKYYTKPSEEVM